MTRVSSTNEFEAAVIGGGPAGLTAACALAMSGIATVLFAAPHRPAAGGKPDTRTAALFNPSLRLLDRIGAWEQCRDVCEPLRAIRLVDDTGGVLRAPEVLFEASEIGEEQFGYNVPQVALVEALRKTLQASEHATIVETEGVEAVATDDTGAKLTLASGRTITADLVVAADGRGSIGRRAARIETTGSRYDQTAIACAFAHQLPHAGISTEFHRKAGPMTVVPMPGNASSLVWVEKPSIADRLAALSDEAFAATLEKQLQGLLGTISDVGPRAMFPLQTMSSRRMAENRTVLIGEAGHVMPPIGAQGLNLSFRDAATLVELAKQAKADKRPLGGDDLLSAYDRRRRFDVGTRSMLVDTLNRTLTSGLLPVQLARGLGLHAIRAIGPLKALAMREGMRPSFGLPELMRP